MGVDARVYGIYGVKIDGYDHGFINRYYEAEEEHDVPPIVFDVMCGKYMVFGHILISFNVYHEGCSFHVFNEDMMKALREEGEKYKKNFLDIFPEYGHYIDHEFEVIFFTHYS